MTNEKAVLKALQLLRPVFSAAQRRRPRGFTMQEADSLATHAETAMSHLNAMRELYEEAGRRLEARRTA